VSSVLIWVRRFSDALVRLFFMRRYRVFISYSRRHADLAKDFYGILFTMQEPFLDERSIKPGDDWQRELDFAVARCSHVLVLWCIHAEESHYVQQEIETALLTRRRIVPIVIGDHPLPPHLRRFQGIPHSFAKFCLRDGTAHPSATPRTDAPEGEAPIVRAFAYETRELLRSDWRHDSARVHRNRSLFLLPLIALGSLSIYHNEASRLARPAGHSFVECAKDCPEMVVVPTGTFIMGSPISEPGRRENEGPQQKITIRIGGRFAVSKFQVTFSEWDACAADGACPVVADDGFGRGNRPVINVSWDDARQYAAWLSRKTTRRYRLLTEAEFEYAARAGTSTAYPWGATIGEGNANCEGCGNHLARAETMPVGSFKPNGFGLFDMQGNVFQWVEDCYVDTLEGMPPDGAARLSGDCSHRVARGGSWASTPDFLRSASRVGIPTAYHFTNVGFRVGTTLWQW
jgi:formylglycine-generating enzyme required for sulfatase activity